MIGTAATMTAETMKELVHRFVYEDLNTPDGAGTDELVSPAFVDHSNPPGMQEGHGGHRAILAYFHAAFEGLRFDILGPVIADGDRVAFRLVMTGRQQGEFFGIPATGREVSVEGTHVLRIEDGQVAEHWGNNDDLGLMRQLGAMPG